MKRTASLLFLVIALLCCAPQVHAVTCGTTTHNNSGGIGAKAIATGAACTPVANSTVTDCKVYVSGAGNVNCAVYDSDGTLGAPKTVLCQGSSTAAGGAGIITVTLSGCPTLTIAHVYWPAEVDSVGTILGYDSTVPSQGYYDTADVSGVVFSNITMSNSYTSFSNTIYFDLSTGGSGHCSACDLSVMVNKFFERWVWRRP